MLFAQYLHLNDSVIKWELLIKPYLTATKYKQVPNQMNYHHFCLQLVWAPLFDISPFFFFPKSLRDNVNSERFAISTALCQQRFDSAKETVPVCCQWAVTLHHSHKEDVPIIGWCAINLTWKPNI